jgi:hypothetical protein
VKTAEDFPIRLVNFHSLKIKLAAHNSEVDAPTRFHFNNAALKLRMNSLNLHLELLLTPYSK